MITFGYLYVAGRMAVYDVQEGLDHGKRVFVAAVSADPRTRVVASTARGAEALLISQLRRWERLQHALPARV